MKILHLSFSDNSGGATKAAYRIHTSLISAGIDSHMLVARKFTSDPTVHVCKNPLVKALSVITPYLDQIPLYFMNTAKYSRLSPAWVGLPILKTVKELKPDLIHLHWICAGFLNIETIGKLKVPLVWRLPDMWSFCGAEHLAGDSIRYKEGYSCYNRPRNEGGIDINKWVWKRKVRNWNKIKDLTIVTPSRWLGNCAKESVLFKDRDVEIIPTGQDITRFNVIDKKAVRSILNLPQNKTIILFSALQALTDPNKGFNLLREALQLLSVSDLKNNIELCIVGNDRFTNFPKLPFKAHFLGKLNDEISLSMAYSAANVIVAPSRQENLPNSLIEAMACGIPSVAFNIGGMSDLIDHKKNGYIVKPFDTNELAEAILWVLCDTKRQEKLSKEARATVERKFTLQHQADQYICLYKRVLNK